MVIVGFITLFMFALVGFGPRFLEKILPESTLVWIEDNDGFGGLLSMSGTVDMADGGGTKGDPKDPYSHLRDTGDGWQGSARIAALPGNQPVFVADVLDGRRAEARNVAPQTVGVLQPVTDCRFTPPQAGSFVAHIGALGNPPYTMALSTYGDAELAKAVRQFAKIYRKSGRKQVHGLSDLSFTDFDVIVTETQRPVYLVLESPHDMRLWNILLAPGARIERVVLIGGRQAGVANLDPAVPVEVMRNAELQACGVPDAQYPLNPGHMLFQSLDAGRLSVEEAEVTLGKIAAANAAWDGWFRDAFGVSANATMAGDWNDGNIAVAGPVPATPEERAVYAKLSGGLARITVDTYVEYPALRAEGADFASRVGAIASAFAWGDLENLKLKENF